MKRKPYSAGAVKFGFWFSEFRTFVTLLTEGRTFDEIKKINTEDNIFNASTPARAKQIYSTVSARIKTIDPSFYKLFFEADVRTQKLYALVAVLAHDTLFFEFVYEVIREKLIIGSDELLSSDLRVFFKNKQLQDDTVAKWQDYTLTRLGNAYQTMLYEAGVLSASDGKRMRKIYRPILDVSMESWLKAYDLELVYKALSGER
jgi:hypothetical protein